MIGFSTMCTSNLACELPSECANFDEGFKALTEKEQYIHNFFYYDWKWFLIKHQKAFQNLLFLTEKLQRKGNLIDWTEVNHAVKHQFHINCKVKHHQAWMPQTCT